MHKPEEPHRCDGGARITLVEGRTPGCQHREKQPKSAGSDVPDVPQIENGRRHYGLSRWLTLSVFRADACQLTSCCFSSLAESGFLMGRVITSIVVIAPASLFFEIAAGLRQRTPRQCRPRRRSRATRPRILRRGRESPARTGRSASREIPP